MSPVADTPDWSSPSGGSPAQLIGGVIGTTGTLLLGSDGTDARAILVDSLGRLIITGVLPFVSSTLVSNAVTIPITTGFANLTNNSSAAATITLTTTGATNGQRKIVRFYDFAAVAEAVTWVGTENTLTTAFAMSKGSTTIPAFAGFIFNGVTSKWSCVAVS